MTIQSMYRNMEWLRIIDRKIKEVLLSDTSGHDYYHAIRVANLCLKINKEEKGDQKVLVAAALLHDIARPEEIKLNKPSSFHINKSVDLAKDILREARYPYSKMNLVLDCIKHHEDYSWIKVKNNVTLETKILQDADRLDAIGAIGIARVFAYGATVGRPLWLPNKNLETWKPGIRNISSISHFYSKLLKLKYEMNTNLGKKIAEKRHKFTEEFLENFLKETEGII